MPTFSVSKAKIPNTLTTPIAYLNSIPVDFFGQSIPTSREQSTYAYWTNYSVGIPPEKLSNQTPQWILLSPGPDNVFNINFQTLKKAWGRSAQAGKNRERN